MTANSTLTRSWSFAHRQIFRFCFAYLSLYILVLFFLAGLVEQPVIAIARMLHITTPVDPNGYGSGDTIFEYVLVFCMLVAATVIGILWGVTDRRRSNYIKAQYWFLMVLRYSLAYFMISYGFAKIYESQFPAPSLSRLLQPYGDSSPMGLAWTFMGASRGFSIFTGGAEFVGGLLILFRRTTVFGALVCITVLSNVAAMNFFYDIPVKLFSLHLLLMAIVILSPDVPRLIKFFFCNRAEAATTYYPVLTAKWEHITYITLKILLVAVFIGPNLYDFYDGEESYSVASAKAPLYGVYDVKTFVKGDDTLAPLITDNFRWRRFVVSSEERGAAYRMNDSASRFDIDIDEKKRTIHLENDKDTLDMVYTQLPDSMLAVTGDIGGQPVKMTWQKKDHTKFLLTSRGFHWVNAKPFNR